MIVTTQNATYEFTGTNNNSAVKRTADLVCNWRDNDGDWLPVIFASEPLVGYSMTIVVGDPYSQDHASRRTSRVVSIAP